MGNQYECLLKGWRVGALFLMRLKVRRVRLIGWLGATLRWGYGRDQLAEHPTSLLTSL